MAHPKKEFVKDHITATIDAKYSLAIKKYRDDPVNLIDGEKPSRSGIVQMALDAFLSAYIREFNIIR